MASKRATTFILDVSMSDENLEQASNMLQTMLNAKIRSGRKTDHVELVLYGTEETDNPLNDSTNDQYTNIIRKFPFASPTVDMIRYLSCFSVASSNHADLVDALIVSLASISAYVRKLKYSKEIYLFTDASKSWNTDDIGPILDEIANLELRVNWIVFPPPGDVSKEIVSSNIEYIHDIIEKSKGESYELELAAHQLAQLRAKQATSVNSRYNLTFGDPTTYEDESLVLRVLMPIKSAAIALPIAKKHSVLSESFDETERTNKVDVFTSYSSTDPALEDLEPSFREVSKEGVIKAYRYGKTLVPWNDDDLSDVKYRCSKGLYILGFIPVTSHWWIMAGIHAVIPDPAHPRSTQAYSSLYRAMVELDACALVRHVGRDDGTVHVGVLMPNPNVDGRKYFMYGVLPFAEDYRGFEFPDLTDLYDEHDHTKKKRRMDKRVKSSADCASAMESLILDMDLMPDDGPELVRKKDSFNPGYQRIYQCIAHRAVHGVDSPLPAIDPDIVKPLDPVASIMDSSRLSAMRVSECFKIDIVVREKRKRGHYGGVDDVEDDGGEAETTKFLKEIELSRGDISGLLTPQVESIGSVDPVGDYKAMIYHLDKKQGALTQILARVNEFVKQGVAYYGKAASCLRVVKENLGGSDAELRQAFVDFKSGVKARGLFEFFEVVVEEGIWDDDALDVAVAPAVSYGDAEDLLDEL